MKDCWSRLEFLAWFLNSKRQVRWCIFNKGTNVLQAYQITSLAEILGTFHSKNNPVWNFRNSTCPNGGVYSSCAVLIQATTHLNIVCVLVRLALYRWALLGTTKKFLSNEKGHSGLNDQNDRTIQSRPPSQVVSKYSGWTKPKWSVSFWFLTKIFGILGLKGRRP